jgi:branched-chain amino acid transport system substrate-binding protein
VLLHRRHLLQAATLLAGTALLGCAPRGPIKIGFLGGMSGRVADLGIEGRDGARIAVEEVNARGGVDGRSVELLTQDDEQDKAIAQQRLTELLDAGVELVVGPMTSAIATVAVPLADARKVPLVSPTATTHELSGLDDMFFRLVPDAPTGARQQAAYLMRRGLRSLVTLTDLKNRAFAQSWTQAAQQQFTAQGGSVLASVEFEAAPGLKYAELARSLVAARPQALVIAASAADCALLVQQVRQVDGDVTVALSPWAGTEGLPQMGGRALEGTIVAQYFDRDGHDPEYTGFVERFAARYGKKPGFPGVNAYDATMLGLDAVRRAESAGGVAAALRATRSFRGLQREVDLDAYGDSHAPMFLTEVRDGAFVSLKDA